jgi:hypothetical protein
MPYKIAGIDVHKRMLHVVVSDVEVDGEYDFTRRVFGSLPAALRSLVAWLVEQQVEEVVMESTAQYWKPVWGTLEGTGNRSARRGKGHLRRREHYILRRRCRTAGDGVARRISAMPNVW